MVKEMESTQIRRTIDNDQGLSFPRFKAAQHDRTLHHPKLAQPTPQDEEEYQNIFNEPHLCGIESEAIIDIESDLIWSRPINNKSSAQKSEISCYSPSHTFVVCADSQMGMSSLNAEWKTELEYCREAIQKINNLHPRPKFVCVCGDLVDMEQTIYSNNPDSLKEYSLDECEKIQQKQIQDFKEVFSAVHPDIALVCLCGNHDIGKFYNLVHDRFYFSRFNCRIFSFIFISIMRVYDFSITGNRPTPKSISKFTDEFGDEYIAFWTNGSYNIILNNVLFNHPDGATLIFEEQLRWLEERLKYANDYQAAQIFVFAHHPWFLYDENEDIMDLSLGGSSYPKEWDDGTGKFDGMVILDSYFSTPKKYRQIALDLFRKYSVNASFAGHFHQNLVSSTSFGMDMIVTGPLSMVLDSSGKPPQSEKNGRGLRIVKVTTNRVDGKIPRLGDGSFTHEFVSI